MRYRGRINMDGKDFSKQEEDARNRIIKRPSRIKWGVNLFVRYLVVIIFFASLILSPFLFGFLWYHIIVADALSSAVIGILCGVIFDFCMLLFVS